MRYSEISFRDIYKRFVVLPIGNYRKIVKEFSGSEDVQAEIDALWS